MLLGYSGALFWRMQAGMGEVIFAPLYEVLRDRGVEFRFFHRVDALRLGDDGRSIAAIDFGVQAKLADDVAAYDPLIRVKGLPCWPDAPLDAQLQATDALDGVDLESLWSPRRDVGRHTLEAGKDFDAVVFAISLGMVPHVCGDLLAASPAWQSMVDNVGTVATQAFQLWLSEDEHALGWSGPAGVTVSGFVKPFDTWASMPHLLPAEDWPETDQPKSIAYFCSVLDTPNSPDHAPDVESETLAVRERARTFLDRNMATLWPAAVEDGGFRWSLLCDPSAGHQRPRTIEHPVLAGEHRSLRPLRAVPARHRPVPPSPGTHRLHQSGRGRRLDGQRSERRVCGGCGPFRATGGRGGPGTVRRNQEDG